MTRQSEMYDEQEIIRRREAALKRMLATPHKPHAKQVGSKEKQAGTRKARPRKQS